MDPKHFELTDRQGETHKYVIAVTPAREGSTLMLRVAAALAEPVLEGLRAALSSSESGQIGDADVGAILDQLQDSGVGQAVRESLHSLDADTLQMFFRYVQRDGKPLRQDANYDAAYAGNWGEWMKALKEVIQFNGFLGFLPGISTV